MNNKPKFDIDKILYYVAIYASGIIGLAYFLGAVCYTLPVRHDGVLTLIYLSISLVAAFVIYKMRHRDDDFNPKS